MSTIGNFERTEEISAALTAIGGCEAALLNLLEHQMSLDPHMDRAIGGVMFAMSKLIEDAMHHTRAIACDVSRQTQ
jgi:hypothetical protein